MKSFVISIIIIFFSIICKANPEDSTDVSHWLLGVEGSFGITGRVLLTDDIVYKDFVQSQKRDEKRDIGVAGGISVTRVVNNSFRIKLGVQYVVFGLKTIPTGLTFGDMIDPRFGFAYTIVNYNSDHAEDGWREKYFYLSFPLTAQANFGTGKVKFIVSGGFSVDAFVKERYYYSYGSSSGKIDNVVSIDEDYRSPNFSLLTSAGIEYPLRKNIILEGGPEFRYQFLSTVNAPVKQNLWNLGLHVGLLYCLN